MQNQNQNQNKNKNKTVLNLDDSIKGRKGIDEMLKHMEEISDPNEKSDLNCQ